MNPDELADRYEIDLDALEATVDDSAFWIEEEPDDGS